MRLYKRLFNKYIQHKRAVFSDSDSAYSVTMLQSLEPRQMYDAALGVEVANLFTPQIVVQGQEADFLAADTAQATNGNQIVDAFVNDTPIDQQIFPSISYESPDVLTSNTHLDDYYSFDKSLVKEVVFVDSAIENYAELIEGVDLDKLISGQLEVVVLKSDYSGIKQISDYLDQYDHQLDAVHIVSHGSVAELKLGSDTLNTASFDNFKTDLAAWGVSFAVGADLLFYGCNVAEGAVGQKFIQDLHSVIETDIAASSDFTGHFNLGGDWDLEVNEGEITAKLAFTAASQMTYEGLLATITVTTLIDEDDVGDQDLAGMAVPDGDGISFREAIAIANSNPGSDTINFSDAISGTITLGSALPNISGATIIDATGHIDFSYTAAVSDKITTSNLQTPIKILAASGNSSLLNFVAGSDDSVVKGLHLALKNPLYNAVSGEVVINAGVNNITIEKNYIATDSVVSSDVQSIYVGYSNTGGQTHTIKDNLIDKNPFVIANFSADAIFIDISGVSSDGSTNDHSITIDHNTIQNVETQAIMTNLGSPFPNNKSLDTYNITNNFFDNIRVHFQDVSVINIGSNNSTGSISNNTFINVRDYSIGLRGNLNSTITISENISTNVSGNIGIDLGNFNAADGATMNDADDIDTGPNALLNFPVLTEILDLGGGVYRIEGYIDSAFTSENRYKIEFFAGDDPLSIQPEFFVGSVTLNNSNSSLEADNGSGSINDRRFTFITSNLTSSGLSLATIRFSAATTDIIGGYTSEVFALNAAAVIPTTIHVTTLVDENDGTTTNLASLILSPGGTGISLREALAAAGNQAGTETIKFSMAGTINLSSNLSLPSNVIVNGTTAPGYVTGTPTVALNFGAFYEMVSSFTSNITIQGLTVHKAGQYATEFGSVTGLTINENVFTSGIAFDSFGTNSNIDITNNSISGGYINIYINRTSTDVTITGNATSNSVLNFGIQFNTGSSGSAGVISNNTFAGGDIVHLRNTVGSYIDIKQNTFNGVGNIPIDILGNSPNTVNDPGDTDTGNNFVQNYPILSSVVFRGDTMNVNGILDTELGYNYRIDFYANDNLFNNDIDLYLGSTTLTNVLNANQAFSDAIDISSIDTSSLGYPFKVTATATRTSGLPIITGIVGGTSELSPSIMPDVQIVVTSLVDELNIANGASATKSNMNNYGGAGLSLREAIYVANNTAGTDTIFFDVSGNFVFSIEAAANLKLPAITETLIIDGTSAPGYVTPVTNVNPNIPSNPTNAGASGLFGVNTTASSNPIGPSQSLLGGVIGSTLDIYDGSNDYEADIKSALDTSGNMKVFFETTNQVGGTSAILQFQSSAANSQVKGIGFLQNSAATSAIRSSVSGVDVIDSYFRGFTSAVSTDGAVVNMDQVTNSVFENSYNAVNQAVLIKHNTIINTSNHVVNQGGDFFYNKVENLGGLIGSGNGSFSGTAGYTTKGNYFNNLNNAGRYNDINFIENEVLNMANTTYAVWAENMVYTTMNKIHDNAGAGIYATAATASGTNRIGAHLANSLYNNGGLGLDVVITGNANAPVGNNTNDFDDLDIYGQNTAYIGQVVQVSSTNGFNGDEGDMIIVGSLNSGNSALAAHSEQFRIDFYANTGGLSGNVNNSEAEYFLGYTIVDATATSTGYKAYFEFTYDYDNPQAGAVANVLLTPGSYILATATGTVPNSATPSGTVFGTSYKTYETSEFSTVGQIIGYTNAQELPTSFTPTIDYTGVITIGNYFTSDSTPILLGESTQPYEANITISIVRIDDNSGGETVVHTANPDDITRDLANGTWEYDLTSYFTAPVGAYRLDVTMDDGSNVALLPGATFSKVFVVAADSNTLGIVGETAYNNATSSYPIEGSVNDSSNPIFIEIDTGDGNGTQILQAIANGPTGWQLTSLPTYNLTDNNVPYVLHVFNNSGSYDTQTIAQGFIVDTINPDVAMNNITGLATALELTGTFVDTNEVTAIIVSIAPTGSMDINNLNPTNTYVVGSDPHSVLNPGFQSVTGLINTASNTWSIDAGQITGLLSGLSYDVVVMGLDPAGNITSLTSGSILSGAITVTQNSDTVLDDILSSLNSLLGDSYLGFSGDYSLTGTDYLDVIDNNTDDVVAAALRAASDAQLAADAALKYAEEAQALADANPANVEYQEAAYAAAQAAEVAQAAADAAQIQANQAQAAQASGDSAAAQQSSASAQAASSAGQAAAQAASGNSSEGGTSGAVAGFTQAFSNVTAGLAGSAGAVANVVFNIALDTMSHKPIESGLAAAAGFTLTLTVISGGQVASVAIASGSAGSGAIAALQNTFTSIFENFSANMLRAGGAPSLSSGSKFKGNVGGAHMSNASAQNQDINQDQQDVEMLEDVDCILSKYVHKVTSKINRQENSVNR